ncbi:hypothetical protein F909_02772 [Acinetobacter sp. ANC 3929]|uniref:hypothetical protein n=1 Tax=unclassified Acinetobacter TaxID=196816 RepID=UPI0002D0082D|nr:MULTISPECIES: hypothetical protein [unclassified Acinetobacter]ENW81481.1 hypothetical protein F909_02772 [Acinetobacter sp. ANC 3929]MCH7351962.1 hypothetical protein [Acinetobacter sp. NIPH 2023]MCH7354518.1 hypothetical protein [Acinetobacter sp. NIPH 1958]MCH7359640.1 hypothetical protein [Acinetobacter sp. NIPH 2024]
MDIFRYLLTIVLFFVGVFCVVRFLLEDFNLIFLALSLVCFLSAYWVKPNRENHDRRNDAWYWFDLIDISVELVYGIITLPLRLLRRIFDFFSPDIP